ncbi:high mobility group protein 20A-like [Biomphalaria glabrata]|uniref:High mobility group protein 20A-like n=3 Tax=Biomphalaria TaxID=6525 RepID=A0A9W2ZEP6_BIOGL|nr:high mobility group protein 20A-like [Biomphalaria glabrata]XP_055873370.1 high mobility group protein 20A-like [Biomphalaria glabrata]XP_055873371.1 high mobility group protein 20A-like [Biomphalaria glabrata]
MIKMDLNSLGSLSNFDTFDDDVSKESNDLTVDAGESPFLSSVSQAAISHGLSIVPEETQEHHSEPMKRKGGWTKGKKRKKNVKDMNAPKQPLSGYLRFLNERRELIRQEKPNLSFAEMSKQLGNEWSHLAQHEKQRYLDDAEREKEKYMKDLEAYKKTETYKTFKQQIDKKGKDDESPEFQGVTSTGCKDEDESGTFDIPIFTEEFLDHNKVRDAELRQLRKQTTELEEQNAILSKHTDNMRQAVERLEVEAQHQRQTNQALLSHLEALRTCLTSSFSSLPLPGTGELPTLETIDTYMARLHSLILDSPQENESLIATVRDIVGRLSIEL